MRPGKLLLLLAALVAVVGIGAVWIALSSGALSEGWTADWPTRLTGRDTPTDGHRVDAPTSPSSPEAPGPDAGTPTAAGDAAPRGRAIAAKQPTPVPITLFGIPTPNAQIELLRSEPPGRDLVDLAIRMGRIAGPPSTVASRTAETFDQGDTAQFWVHNIQHEEYFTVTATMEYATHEAYFWVQEGEPFDRTELEIAAEEFSAGVVSAVRETFGTEWRPGIDGDPRMHLLHHEHIPGIAGYFSSTDEFTVAVEPHSNEREMFYINLSIYEPGSYDYLALLAHEFQHMIHWHRDRDEPVWANEGLSELAAEVAGYQTQTGNQLLRNPDTALLEWEPNPGSNGAHYAASYLFMAYLREQYGDELISAVVNAEENGPSGIEAALTAFGKPRSFDEVFLDWTLANLFDDPFRADGTYSYRAAAIDVARPEPLPEDGISTTVHQYGTDYYDVTSAVEDAELQLSFEGESTVSLLSAAPPVTATLDTDGRVWWSNRGDSSDSRLTVRLDLADASEAALTFRMWYELEENWDYAYFLVSGDGGESWSRVATGRTTDTNPNGNNYGSGLTGSSGAWVRESIDLSAYAGGRAWVLFDVVTDDAVTLPGMAVTDLRLAKTLVAGGDWREEPIAGDRLLPEGWIRLDPVLPQRWGLQVALDEEDVLEVRRYPVQPDGTANVEWANIPGDARLFVAVSGLTPATRNVAAYSLAPAK